MVYGSGLGHLGRAMMGSGILRIPEKRLVGATCGPPFPWAPWVNQSDLRLEAKKGVVVAKMDVTAT
jgi:hypothetical protein